MKPKWINKDRIHCLTQLADRYPENHCNLGHFLCANPAHYSHVVDKLDIIVTGKDVPCKDDKENYILDRFGNPALRRVIQIERKHYQLNVTYMSNDSEPHMLNNTETISQLYIQNWSNADRENTIAEYQAEAELRHKNYDARELPIRGTFSGIAKDIYYDTQPVFRIECMSINGTTGNPMAKIRMTSDNTILYVDVSSVMPRVSKHARLKAKRHNVFTNSLRYKIDLFVGSVISAYRFGTYEID